MVVVEVVMVLIPIVVEHVVDLVEVVDGEHLLGKQHGLFLDVIHLVLAQEIK
jgi:hypothetical protein